MKNLNEFIRILTKQFYDSSDAGIAKQQKAYMKDKFEFFGLKAP
ncbi:hypothetical protein ABXT64_02430 [Candidatus Marifrigoribacter sp. Uisw_064]|jgi:hypothetical protein